MPSLAVVVPAIDEADCLPGLLDALGAARGPDRPDEVVVADGGSADGSAELAAARSVSVVRAARGRGPQLAAGAEATSAELLLFLHADARPAPGAVAAVRAAFADPGVVATGMRQRVAGRGPLYRMIERAADLKTARGLVYGDSGLAARRTAYEAAGGFRDLPIFEDLDLSRRLRRLGRVALVRDATLHVSARRWKREGILRRTAANWLLTAAWAAGVSPERLARWYRPHSSAAPRSALARGRP